MDGPIPYNIIIPLEQKDQQFLQIQKLIETKQHFLQNKHKKLCLIQKQNTFLDDIKKDYASYFQFILQQKYQQMKAMEILNNYINQLTTSGHLTKQNIEDAKQEQRIILKELKSIKHSLNSLINDIGDVGNKLKEKQQINSF